MKKVLLLVAVLVIAQIASADLLVAYDFAGYAGSESPGTSTTVNVNMQDPAYIDRGAGVGVAGNANRFNGNGWTETSLANAITADDYFTWTLNVDAGYSFNVTNFIFNFQRSSTGGQDWTLRSSVDSFASDLNTWTALANGNYVTDLSSANLTNLSTVEFRMYGYNGTGSAGSAGYEGSGDDLVMNGTVQAIPEPTTLALFGGALAGLLFYRRRRTT